VQSAYNPTPYLSNFVNSLSCACSGVRFVQRCDNKHNFLGSANFQSRTFVFLVCERKNIERIKMHTFDRAVNKVFRTIAKLASSAVFLLANSEIIWPKIQKR
jgi:hypothetical protein